MKKSSLRKTLLSLLGLAPHLSRAQTTTAASSWGAPFTVDTPSASTDALLPSSQQTPSSAPYASFLTPPASSLSTAPTGLAMDTTPPVLSRATVTLISGTNSRVSASSSPSSSEEVANTSASVTMSTTTGGVRSTITLASASAQATGAAGGRGYRKMGFVGAVAGAAGVMAW